MANFDIHEWNRKNIEEFRANKGQITQFNDVVLITTKGRKSGKTYVNPLVYLKDGDRVLVFASKAGSDTNPDWYNNIVANPRVTVEIGDEKYDAKAVVLEGEERDRLYAKQAGLSPQFAEYQSKTKRVIPVVALERA